VDVSLRLSEAGDAAIVDVVDDGPGIPAETLPLVFERFVRGDGSRSRSGGGTGLGLAIAHSIVTAHGGTLDVESRPGRTRFRIALPRL
jgi:two-component system OmpR family sensor kinase